MRAIRFTGRQVIWLTIVTLAGVICSVKIQFPLVIGFLPGFIMLLSLSRYKKVPAKKIFIICANGINKTKIVILILFLVSFLLPSWYLSGTIGQMVNVSLHFMTPTHFFVDSFLAALIFSMILGTSIGTLSSIGVSIIGTAVVLHIPTEIVAGALISGAFVGDRTSPFSSSHQLLSHTVEMNVQQQFKSMLVTTITAVVVSLLFFGILDLHHTTQAATHLKQWDAGKLSFVTFIPPLLLIVVVLFRFSIVYAFLASILSAVWISVYNGNSFIHIANDLWNGIDGLGGGFIHMYELLLFLVLAGAYNGLLEELNVIQPFLDKWLQASQSLAGDTVKTIVATLLISFIAANQTLPIILTGRSFLPHWSTRYSNRELARVMGDSTMLFPGLVPWSVLTIMCSTIVGVSLFHYLPYAIFLWILPCLTMTVSVIKQFKNKRKIHSASV